MAYIGNSPENIQRGRRAIYEFTSTAGQTVYTGLDDNNQTLDLLEANEQSVFLNGVRLIPTDDYTVSGDTLTLTSAASLNDFLVVETQAEIANSSTYTRAEADARYINYNGDIVAGNLQINGEVDADSLVVDTDTLYVDATNDRVGIGTDSPSTSLDVVRAGVQPLRVQSTSGTEVQINMVNTGGNVQLEAHNNNFNIDADAVGIGTDSPRSELSIAANNSGQGAKLTLENTDTSITTNDVIGQIDFYANDSSTNGTGAKVNIKAIATSGAGTVTALTLGVSDSASATAAEIMRLKSTEVGWSNTTNGFYNKIYGPTSGDIASG